MRLRWCAAGLAALQGAGSTPPRKLPASHMTGDGRCPALLLKHASPNNQLFIPSPAALCAWACRTLLSKKYGCANISFTHDPYSVIASSNKASCG